MLSNYSKASKHFQLLYLYTVTNISGEVLIYKSHLEYFNRNFKFCLLVIVSRIFLLC